jgi:hypothetical protein
MSSFWGTRLLAEVAEAVEAVREDGLLPEWVTL